MTAEWTIPQVIASFDPGEVTAELAAHHKNEDRFLVLLDPTEMVTIITLVEARQRLYRTDSDSAAHIEALLHHLQRAAKGQP